MVTPYLPRSTRVWRISSFPRGEVSTANFELVEQILPSPKENEILVRADYFSVDPYMRMMLSELPYGGHSKLGDPMRGALVGTVLSSRSERIKAGQQVTFMGPWAEHSVRNADHVRPLPVGVDAEGALSVVGITALTALFGLRDVGDIKAGERILVTSAGGGVGYIVCKLALLFGATPIALCGTDLKVSLLRDLGVKHVINYHAPEAVAQIKQLVPEGVEVLWDSIGGKAIAPFRRCLARFGRIIQCGALTTYNDRDATEPAWGKEITANRWTVRGFIVSDFHARYDDALAELAQWYREGKIPARVCVRSGFDQLPDALGGLFRGANTGKQLVKASSFRGTAAPSGDSRATAASP